MFLNLSIDQTYKSASTISLIIFKAFYSELELGRVLQRPGLPPQYKGLKY